MDVSLISNCYELKEIAVEPSQLLVDPNNPRIAMDLESDRKFTLEDVVKPDMQRSILSLIDKNAYHIAELIHGIRTFGFIYTGDDMIVKRVPRRTHGADTFLVIEGNRRTTAIRHLLESQDLLATAVARTLKSLRVKEFIYVPNDDFTEDAVIDILVGKIHINGHLPWGALERAHYIYKSYLRESESNVGHRRFEYVVECAKEIAAFFGLKVGEVRKNLMVYRVYEQLKWQGFQVKPDHFSLIEMAVSNGACGRTISSWMGRPSTSVRQDSPVSTVFALVEIDRSRILRIFGRSRRCSGKAGPTSSSSKAARAHSHTLRTCYIGDSDETRFLDNFKRLRRNLTTSNQHCSGENVPKSN